MECALALPGGTWVHAVLRFMHSTQPPIPSLLEAQVCPAEILASALNDKNIARNIVRKYRMQVVQPRLAIVDDKEYEVAATKVLPGLGCSYQDLCPIRTNHAWFDLVGYLPPTAWDTAKIWNFVRMTGLWPLSLFIQSEPVPNLSVCPLCGQTSKLQNKHAPEELPGAHAVKTLHLLEGTCPR